MFSGLETLASCSCCLTRADKVSVYLPLRAWLSQALCGKKEELVPRCHRIGPWNFKMAVSLLVHSRLADLGIRRNTLTSGMVVRCGFVGVGDEVNDGQTTALR